MAATRFLGVSRPRIRGQDVGWVAQKRALGLYKARFRTARAAAEWLAKRMHVPLGSLLRVRARAQLREGKRPTAALTHSQHPGVIADRGRWVARVGGRTLGRFASQKAAARCVSKALRQSVVGWSRVKSARKKSLSRALLRRLFQAGLKAFGNYIPGDLESLRVQEKVSHAMFSKEPCQSLGVRLHACVVLHARECHCSCFTCARGCR